MEAQLANSPSFSVHAEHTTKSFRKDRDAKSNVSGKGHFSLHLKVTAVTDTLYVPLSIASGKKPAGFVYQIKGTGESKIVSADVSPLHVKETSVTQILVGTITYIEIPKGMTAIFHISIVMKGKIGKEYSIAITTLRYKHSLSDARYQEYVEEIQTGTLKFH